MESYDYLTAVCIRYHQYPHEEFRLSEKQIPWKKYKKAWMSVWWSDFDCKEETQYWFCIKDNAFDIDSLKAKRRYEVNKGIKNFDTRIIDPRDHAKELYHVYLESLNGYTPKPKGQSFEEFSAMIDIWVKEAPAANVFAAFCKEDGVLCGYADVFDRERYLPISSLKTIPEYEKRGVNFALVYTICTHFAERLQNGAYLSDGARNAVHQTNFQLFLEKYFGFRKAYVKLNVRYRKPFGVLVKFLFPFRTFVYKAKKPILKSIGGVLKYEAWYRGLQE